MDEEKDLVQACVDCGREFIFSVGEQRFYKDRGLFAPKRCAACRKLAKLKNLTKRASETA